MLLQLTTGHNNVCFCLQYLRWVRMHAGECGMVLNRWVAAATDKRAMAFVGMMLQFPCWTQQ